MQRLLLATEPKLWRQLWEGEWRKRKPKDKDGNPLTFLNWLHISPFSDGKDTAVRTKTLNFMLKVRDRFAAHMHVKFPALVPHMEVTDHESQPRVGECENTPLFRRHIITIPTRAPESHGIAKLPMPTMLEM